MKDVYEYALKAMEMLDAIGIKYGNVTSVTVNNKLRRAWGRCIIHIANYNEPAQFTIEISRELVDTDSSDDGLMNTMLHELLHSAAWAHHHGGLWLEYAEKVRKAYGYNIKQYSSEEDMGMTEYMKQKRAEETAARISKRYQVYCPECDAVLVSRERLCKYTRDVMAGKYVCGGCRTKVVIRDGVTGELLSNTFNK